MKRKKGRSQGIRKVVLLAIIIAVMMACSFAYAGEDMNRYTLKTYAHNSVFSNHVIVSGVDVSAYQSSLDWSKMKADGIDYAIIRIGGRGYGNAGKMYADDMFKTHMKGAKDADMLVGIYFYSQCKTVAEAKEEVAYIVELLTEAGYSAADLDLPIYMDYEIPSGSRISSLSKSTRTKCVEAWLSSMEDAGFKAGFYTYLAVANSKVDGQSIASNHDVWMAHYNTSCGFTGSYQMWQYSSSGQVFGSGSRLDLNYWYLNLSPVSTVTPVTISENETILDTSAVAASLLSLGGNDESTVVAEGEKITPTKSITEAVVKLKRDSFTYSAGTEHRPEFTVTYLGRLLEEGVDYEVKYLKNVQAGKGYVYVTGKGDFADYKLTSFTIEPSAQTDALTIPAISSMTYTGAAVKPKTVSLKEINGNELSSGVDYSFTTSNDIDAGTASLTVTFTGNYTGTRTLNYTINRADQILYIDNKVQTASVEDEAFNIKAHASATDSVITYFSSNPEVADISEDGTVTIIGSGETKISVIAAQTLNYNQASATYTLTVKGNEQVVTTGYSKYKKEITSGSFNLNAKTEGNGALSYEVETEEIESNDDGQTTGAVVRVTESGRVIIMGEGKATIHVKAAATSLYEAGQKDVEVTVYSIDEDIAVKNSAIEKAIKSTGFANFTASSEADRIDLGWIKGKSKYGVDYYQIWRSTKKSSGYKKIYITKTSSTHSYTDKNVSSDTKYYYKIRGVRYVNGKAVYTPFVKIETKTET